MPNGIYIQTEYHGKLIRKIVCNGEEHKLIRWVRALKLLKIP